jgi:hypothetical protein
LFSSARRRLGVVTAGCALTAAALLVPAVSAAQASLINLNTCNSNALSQPFAPWGDNASYELAPGGDFESGSAAWSMTGGAQIVPGSEPFAATGTLGSSSLSLPALSTATSPSTCVDAAYPTVRFFIGGTGTVAVSMVYDGLAIPAGVAIAGGSWSPSPIGITTSPLWGLLAGGTAQVKLQFTALLGSPTVDDVFVDPWQRS